MLPCKMAEILEDAVDTLVGLAADPRMPEDLGKELVHKADSLLERIQEAQGHE